MKYRSLKKILFLAVILVLTVVLLGSMARVYYPVKYKDSVMKYSGQYGLDPYLVFAVIKVESSFRPSVVSSKLARGLMQVSDKTGKWAFKELDKENFSSQSLYDPDINIQIGCWYLNTLLRQFGNNMDTVLAAYNAGSGKVAQWLKDPELSRDGVKLDRIPFKETERYLNRVKNCYSIYKKLYESGF